MQDLKLFSNNFHTLVEKFEGSSCLVFETPINVAVECLTEFRDRLSVLQVAAKVWHLRTYIICIVLRIILCIICIHIICTCIRWC